MRVAINPPSSLACFQFITPLPQCSRAGAGFSWRDPGEGAAGEATQNTLFHRHLPIHCSHVPHPTRASRSSPARGAGAVQVISPERPAREPAPILFSAGIFPCTGPWGYHPGWGRGGNPLPVVENHTGPPSVLPPRSGRFRGESPGGARAWGGDPKHSFPQVSTHTLLSCTPTPTPTPPALRAPPPPGGRGQCR